MGLARSVVGFPDIGLSPSKAGPWHSQKQIRCLGLWPLWRAGSSAGWEGPGGWAFTHLSLLGYYGPLNTQILQVPLHY